jgi:hypothetical protein
MYVGQFDPGRNYKELRSVISICLLNKQLFCEDVGPACRRPAGAGRWEPAVTCPSACASLWLLPSPVCTSRAWVSFPR